MKEFTDYILRFGSLSQQQVDLIVSKTFEMELKKEEYFSEAGKVPKQIAFVKEGVLRGCYYNNKSEEITRCFIAEESLACDYMNFEAETVSTEYLQACTDLKLIVFSKKDWDELSHTISGWDAMKGKMVQLCMHQKARKGPVISQDATTRYLEFMKNYQSLVNRVPLVYIASYLGVTQQSLSRIRKNIR